MFNLETIRTNKLLNILIAVISATLIAGWFIMSHPYILYAGLFVCLYWALFWLLQYRDHSAKMADPEYVAELAEKKKLRKQLKSKKQSLKDKLAGKTHTQLVITILKDRARRSVIQILFATYILGVSFILFPFLNGLAFWASMIVGALYFGWGIGHLAHYIYELRSFRRSLYSMPDIGEVVLTREDVEAAMALFRTGIENAKWEAEHEYDVGEGRPEVETSMDLEWVEHESEVEDDFPDWFYVGAKLTFNGDGPTYEVAEIHEDCWESIRIGTESGKVIVECWDFDFGWDGQHRWEPWLPDWFDVGAELTFGEGPVVVVLEIDEDHWIGLCEGEKRTYGYSNIDEWEPVEWLDVDVELEMVEEDSHPSGSSRR